MAEPTSEIPPLPIVRRATAGAQQQQLLAGLRVVMAVAIALVLVVPESEIRAKTFKANLIVKNFRRLGF